MPDRWLESNLGRTGAAELVCTVSQSSQIGWLL